MNSCLLSSFRGSALFICLVDVCPQSGKERERRGGRCDGETGENLIITEERLDSIPAPSFSPPLACSGDFLESHSPTIFASFITEVIRDFYRIPSTQLVFRKQLPRST